MGLAVTKSDLMRHIGRKLGYSRTVSTIQANATWLSDVTDALNNALRRFYDPEVIPKHHWSFLRPIRTLQFITGQYRVDLPPDFAMLWGPITYNIGEDTVFPPLQKVGVHQVLHHLQQDDSTSGRPRMFAVNVKAPDPVMATRYELLIYPTSDDDYTVIVPMKVDPFSLDFDAALPLGSTAHAQTLIAACIAEAVALMDEYDDGKAEDRFQRFLAASIDHDQQLSCPETLGYNGDHSDGYDLQDPYVRRILGMNSGLVLYNGVVPGG